MARTELNSSAIPAGTVVSSDLTFPLTNFSSTGIDDNASSVAITVDSSGRVGIGNTSPDAGLVVHDNAGLVVATSAIARQTYTSVGNLQVATSGSGGILIHSGASNIGYLSFGDGQIAGRIAYNHGDNTMYFYTDNNNERMRLLDGPVLQFTDAVTTGTTIGEKGTKILLKSDSSTVGNGGEIVWTGNADEGGERWAAISGWIRSNSADGCAGDIQFSTKELDTANTMSERMRICANGNIGIGTEYPSSQLLVDTGDNNTIVGVSSPLDSSAFSQVILHHGAQGQWFGSNTVAWQLFSDCDGTDSNYRMSYFDGTSYSHVMYIRPSGNMGLGLSHTSPQKPLSVLGGILAATSDGSTSGITIDSTATSGYASTITHTDTGIEFDTGSTLRDFVFDISGTEHLRITGDVGSTKLRAKEAQVGFYVSNTKNWVKIFERHYLNGSAFSYGQHNLTVTCSGGTNGHGSVSRIHINTKQQGTADNFDISYIECAGANYANVVYYYNSTGGSYSDGILTVWIKPQITYNHIHVHSDSSQPANATNAGEIMAVNTGSETQPTNSTEIFPNLGMSTNGRVHINQSPRVGLGGFGTEAYGGMSVFPDAGFSVIQANTTNYALYVAKTSAATGEYINFATAGTARGAIVEEGANIGIRFGPTNTTAHTFDDYEEGTWTPVLTTSNGDGSYSMTVQKAVYRKIGATVFYSTYISAVNVGNPQGTGNMRITGLPFTGSSESNSYSGGVSVYGSMIAHTRVHINTPGGTYLRLMHHEDVAGEFDMTAAQLGTGSKGSWIFQGFYTTD